MKYILIFLFAFLCSIGYAQNPINQYIGAPATLVTSRGGFKADSSLILPQFPDTTAANRSPYIKFYPGNLIRVYNDVYMRNTTATRWILISNGGGSNNFVDSIIKVGDSVYARKYGVFVYQYTDSAQKVLANNGLSFSGDTLQLGGRLTKNDTRIYGDGNQNIRFDSLGLFQLYCNDPLNQSKSEFYGGSGLWELKTYSQSGDGQSGFTFAAYNGDFIPSSARLFAGNGIPQDRLSQILVLSDSIVIEPNDSIISITKVKTNVDTSGYLPLMYNPNIKRLETYSGGFGKLGVDTTSLSNRINEKIDSLYKSGDSVYARKNGAFVFQYIDPAIDTTSLSNRINLKLNISDTASMLAPYYRAADTVNLRRVKYVGLTMPSAFNVTGSPITDSGTIAVTGAGTSSQYIRGDGVLASFPTATTGGGASVSYYLNGSVNKGTFAGQTYYEMSRTAIIGAGTDFTRTNTQGDGLVAQFITDTITNLLIPAGNWNLELYFNASSGGGTPSFYVELYKYDGTNFTLISSNSTSPELIAFGTTINPYFTALAVPETVLSGTDRLAIRVYVTTSGRSITLHTENSHLCQIITTFTTGLTAINGLTKQVQYFAVGTSGTDFNISSSNDTHTFNLPTASVTNRGALSSTDWSTFNGKLNPSDTTSLSNRINTKLNISDTSAMLSPYLRSIDTTNKYVTSVFRKTASDSVFFVRGGSNNFAFRDSTGGGNIYNTNGTLTGNRTLSVSNNSLTFGGSANAASGVSNPFKISPTLNATANSDTLVALEINPTFNSGAFTTRNFSTIFRSNILSYGKIYLGSVADDPVNIFVQTRAFSNSDAANAVGIAFGGITTTDANSRFGFRAGSLSSTGILRGAQGFQCSSIGTNAVGFSGNVTTNSSFGTFMNTNTSNTNQFFSHYTSAYQSLGTGSSVGFNFYNGGSNQSNFRIEQKNNATFGVGLQIASATVASPIMFVKDRTTNAVVFGSEDDLPSAQLAITSTTRGFLQPRLTTTQMNAISTPATGLSVFNTTDSAIYIRRGTGAGWQQVANEIIATGTLDFANTNSQTSSDLTITLTGAVDGDAVILGVPNAAVNANSCYTAWVSAANTVTVRFNNYSSGAINPASATFKVTIIK